jgi:hypothetical protein
LPFNFLINFNKTGDIQGNGQKLPDLCGDMGANRPRRVIGYWLSASSRSFFVQRKHLQKVGNGPNRPTLFFGLLPKCLHYSVSIIEIANTLWAFLKGPAGLEVSNKLKAHFPARVHINDIFFSVFLKHNFHIYFLLKIEDLTEKFKKQQMLAFSNITLLARLKPVRNTLNCNNYRVPRAAQWLLCNSLFSS